MKTGFLAAAVLLLLGALAPSPALALRKGESSRDFALDLRFGLWKPSSIDSGLGAKPYEKIFGTNAGLMPELGAEWIPWDGYGVFSIGGSAGFTWRSGNALTTALTPSQDTTELMAVPLSLYLSYRWDYLMEQWNIPLVPYVRGGFSYWIWWVFDQKNSIAEWTDGSNAIGGKPGLHVRPGVAFLLDFIDTGAANDFDSSIGVNNSYLYFEGNFAWVNGFGAGGLDFSSNSFSAGLLFEF
ncbi:MAG: hypothetical protein GMKNLPBB_01603 [Myxococcota bacterium]|nr:hypothetical protein [Myxococcota bacterium]